LGVEETSSARTARAKISETRASQTVASGR
jgi:hypothetical protein